MLFDPIEEDELDAAIRRGAEFRFARNRVRSTLTSLPWQESESRRGWVTRTVDALVWRESAAATPFGWTAERCWDRHAVEVGPAWYILPRRWFRALRWHFYVKAIDIGAAVGPEGCYFSELEWWPKGPRVTRRERVEQMLARRSA